MIAIQNILVATDFSAASTAALQYGMDFARNYRAPLHVLHVVDDLSSRLAGPGEAMPDIDRLQRELESDARRMLDNMLTAKDRKALNAHPVTITSPRIAETIVSYAREAKSGLLIIGTHGRTGLARFFMGSVAQHVVRSAGCPVLTVRHPEWELVRPDALPKATANSTLAAVNGK